MFCACCLHIIVLTWLQWTLSLGEGGGQRAKGELKGWAKLFFVLWFWDHSYGWLSSAPQIASNYCIVDFICTGRQTRSVCGEILHYSMKYIRCDNLHEYCYSYKNIKLWLCEITANSNLESKVKPLQRFNLLFDISEMLLELFQYCPQLVFSSSIYFVLCIDSNVCQKCFTPSREVKLIIGTEFYSFS